MPAEPCLGLVVRGSDWSESSRIVTLFTREHGKLRGLAKGGRRVKSSFETAFDLLTVCRVMVIRKHHGGLDLLTEAQVVERFPHLRTDLAALYAGYYVAELLADGTADADPHPPLFNAALETLRIMAARETDRPAAAAAFELAWLRELGYSPRLETCAGCGTPVEPGPNGRVGFSPTHGGTLCPACLPTAPDRRWLSAAGLLALRRLAVGDRTPLGPVAGELRAVLGHTVSAVLGRRPRLLAYLDGPGGRATTN